MDKSERLKSVQVLKCEIAIEEKKSDKDWRVFGTKSVEKWDYDSVFPADFSWMYDVITNTDVATNYLIIRCI